MPHEVMALVGKLAPFFLISDVFSALPSLQLLWYITYLDKLKLVKLGNDSLDLGLSQFLVLPQLPQK